MTPRSVQDGRWVGFLDIHDLDHGISFEESDEADRDIASNYPVKVQKSVGLSQADRCDLGGVPVTSVLAVGAENRDLVFVYGRFRVDAIRPVVSDEKVPDLLLLLEFQHHKSIGVVPVVRNPVYDKLGNRAVARLVVVERIDRLDLVIVPSQLVALGGVVAAGR